MTSITVQESRNVFHENPIIFLLELQDAIYDGFRVQNTIAGYPSLNAILKEVRTYRKDESVEDVIKPIEGEDVQITNYDPMLFLLDVQNAVLQDFQVDKTSVSFDSPKHVRMLKVAPTATLSLDIPKPVAPVVQEKATPKPRQQRKAKG